MAHRNQKAFQLIAGRYQYNPTDPIKQTDMYTQYRAIDKALNNRSMILQILSRSDHLLQLLRDIKHPYIAALFDCTPLQDGRVAALYEAGVVCNLDDVLKNVKFIKQQDALVLFKHMVLAVKELHEKSINIHRLCLQNFVFSSPTALKLGYTTYQQDLPVQYKAPQILKGKQAGPEADVFSLGVILYRMLYGCLPFKGDSVDTIIKQIRSKNLDKNHTPSPLKIVVSREIHYLMLSMLDYFPENRPKLDSILQSSYMSFSLQADQIQQQQSNEKGKKKKNVSIVPQSFYKQYLIFRSSKTVCNNFGYWNETTYMALSIKEKTLVTLYAPEYQMYQAQPRKVQSFYEKLKAIQQNFTEHGTQYLCRVQASDRFRQQPVIITEYCNQGTLTQYLQKRKISLGWISTQQANLIMYIMAIALKQLKQVGVTSLHTISYYRIMIANYNIKLRQPGLIAPIVQKRLRQNSNSIDFFAPQLKQQFDFVELDKSDLYSYGILYYYLLQGKLPELNQEDRIDIYSLKTHQKNKNIIGKCLDQTVSKRINLQDIKLQDINQTILEQMLADKDDQENPPLPSEESQLDDRNKGRRKVLFKNRKKKIFKHYNKIIAQSSTSFCRKIIKCFLNLVLVWIVFFGIFFINGGIGLLRANYYRPITLSVVANYGTSLYNLTILTTNGANIQTNYKDYSYERFTKQLNCMENHYSNDAAKNVDDFINGAGHTIFCFLGFIYAILFSIIIILYEFYLDLPAILVRRKEKNTNKELYHFIYLTLMLPSLLFCFFFIFALEYVIQMQPCLGIANLGYPQFTSVYSLLKGDLTTFFLNVFLTVILWAALMFIYSFATLLIRRINNRVYEWKFIIPTVVLMVLFILLYRIGIGISVPIEPTYSYKMSTDIILTHFGFFGLFPEILFLIIFLIDRIIDFTFWVLLRCGMEPADEEPIQEVQFLKIRAEPEDNKLMISEANLDMIEHKWDFE